MSQIGGSGSGSSSVGDPVSVGHGGTGLTTIASGKILYSSALDTIAALGLGTHLSISGGNLVTDATSTATASKLVTRDASGDAAFHGLSVSTNLIADATVQGLTLKTSGATSQIVMLDRDLSGHECDIVLDTSVLSIFLSENGSTWTFDDINSGLFTTPNLRVNGVTTFVSGTITASSAPYIDGSQTWNNAAVVFTAIKSNVTNTASATGSLLMDLQVASASKFSVDKAGAVAAASTIQAPAFYLPGSGSALICDNSSEIRFGTGAGSKIGTATNQKMAFWNATPVVQQVLATGAAHTVDDVITLLQTLGLCKQS